MDHGASDDERPYVFAAVEVVGVEIIDTGRTLVVRLRRADTGEAAVLLSALLALDLARHITDKLNGPSDDA